MKIAVSSYQMLFQTEGGLQNQVRETVRALNDLGCAASLLDPIDQRLVDFDLCHVFCAINGTFRTVEYSKALGVPVVMSPLIQPYWTRWLGMRAALCDRITGRITGWHVRTEYRELKFALSHADLLVALSRKEKARIEAAFGIHSSAIRIVPNGIPDRFYHGDPALFRERHGLRGRFVLNVASIDANKNQLSLAKACREVGVPLVLIGPCRGPNKKYLDDVLAVPGTRYLGSMHYDDPLLPSAYAAADIFCLPSFSEVMPLSILEALASGTPVVMTRNHCMDTQGFGASVVEVMPGSVPQIAEGIRRFLASRPPSSSCVDTVAESTWGYVATRLIESYQYVLAKNPRDVVGH